MYLIDFSSATSNLSLMSCANKFDRAELRRDRRYAIPIFDIIVETEIFRSLDWSAGGVHLDGKCADVALGSHVDGWLALPDAPQSFAFSGRVLRTDPTTGNTVVRFDELEPEAIGFLDRVVVSRLH
jgi:hypothetical protein